MVVNNGADREHPDRPVLGDLGRLRLETLLRELVDRASELIESEGRLHRLLDAVIGVGADLRLPQVLRTIVEGSCQLVGARQGVLGVIGPNQTLEEVAYTSDDASTRHHTGPLLEGHGILRLLIDNPRPLRLHELTTHPRYHGLTATSQPMTSFVGVPVRVRDEVFGSLFLTGKQGDGDFSEGDVDAITALAAAAGIAIENAGLFGESEHRELWLQATTEITAALLGGHAMRDVLTLIAERAKSVTGASFVAIALSTDDDSDKLTFDLVDGGPGDAELTGHTAPVDGSVCGEVFSSATSRNLEDASTHHPSWAGDAMHVELGPAMLVPLAAGQNALGVLVIANLPGTPTFHPGELRMAENFAGHVALAIEFARAQTYRQRVAVYEDRDRIARDLHDKVIQRLFAIALGLEGTQRVTVKAEVAERLRGYVADIDATIAEIRRTIFSLQATDPHSPSLRAEVLGICSEAAESLGFEPHLRLEGPLDYNVPPELRPDLLATLREAVSNTARHAAASDVEVVLRADSHHVELVVTDNGKGIPPGAPRGSGLSNMTERANRAGGTCTIQSGPGGGTNLSWRVPLAP